jgi:DNA polymerase (family 10)
MHNPYVTLIAHPTGRLMGQRDGYPIDLEAVYRAAKDTGTALEINAQPRRLDLSDAAAKRAGECGVTMAISTDTHSANQLDYMALGLGVARRAWLTPKQILNCLPRTKLLDWIAVKRARARRAA